MMYENPINYNDFTDPDLIIRETLSEFDDGYGCKPTVVEVVEELTEDGCYKEKQVYNCSNCVNIDCPYFYEFEGEE